MSDNIKKVLLVGTGPMAMEYIKVLRALSVEYVVVGNRKDSVCKFNQATGECAVSGGVENYIHNNMNDIPEYAIVAVNGLNLYTVSMNLLNAGVSNLLIEKPGAIYMTEIELLIQASKTNKACVYVAYNRRFYNSVEKAKEIIDLDGGLVSMNFEFTEWQHVIEKTQHPEEIKRKWFLMNSTHVVDLAFHLAGNPTKITTHISGELNWHDAGSSYVGCGVTEKNVLFTYQANWNAPGRWGIELLTKCHRLYLRPMEKLQIQNKGSVLIEDYELESSIDVEYKAGLFSEVKAFIKSDAKDSRLCTLEEQREHMNIYRQISGEEY